MNAGNGNVVHDSISAVGILSCLVKRLTTGQALCLHCIIHTLFNEV